MINLLPPAEKLNISLEKKEKITTILWFLAVFFLLSFILILISVKFYLQQKIEYQKISLNAGQRNQSKKEIKEVQEKFNNFNAVFKKLDDFYNKKIYFSDSLDKVSKLIPEESYLNEVSTSLLIASGDAPSLKISLSGYITSRENLFQFKKDLEKENIVKEVYFPPTNWVKPKDINFFVNFKMYKQ